MALRQAQGERMYVAGISETQGRQQLKRRGSVVGECGDQMAIFNCDWKAYQLGVGAVHADALGILEAPAVGGAHEHAGPIHNLYGLVRADVG